MIVEVKTQIEFEAAMKAGNIPNIIAGIVRYVLTGTLAPDIVVSGSAELELVCEGSSQPRVVAWGSSQPRVEAWGSSQPRVVARESSQPRVVARESSQPRVEAWESSQPRVVASGWVQLSLLGAVVAKVAAKVAVLIEGDKPRVTGGKQTRRPGIKTAADWCAYYGVPVKKGVAVLYTAVRANYKTHQHGFDYTPGTTPVAPDWDGGSPECGNGLHFSPSPAMARAFDYDAEKYVACPVALADIAVHTDGEFLQKVKARTCAGPVWEVDEDG